MTMNEPNFEFLHGRTTKKLIELPESWEEEIDMSTVTIHLTQVGIIKIFASSVTREERFIWTQMDFQWTVTT